MSDNIPKTSEQIKTEIDALQAAKPFVRKRNFWGDNLHTAIDAQINVLVSNIGEDEIYNRYKDGSTQDAALDALHWRDGELRDDDEFEGLAEGWLDIGLE